jgi:branched-chain amino acid transport system substrate-binding protein
LRAQTPDRISIGYIATLSGPGGLLGEEMVRGFRLMLEANGNRLGGVPVDLVVGDDQARPQVATQLARQMMERDNVHFVTGLVFSHVVEAVVASVLPTGRIVVATVGGSSELAGPGCNRNFFIVSWNTDTMFEAIGEHLKRQGARRVAAIAHNFQAGWDAVAGFKRTYGGDPVTEILVRLDQSEFSAEITQIRQSRPDALVYFLPGGAGNAFLRQYAQAGLFRTARPVTATVQVDELSFSAVGDAALGLNTVGPWSPTLDNPANRRFVESFAERHGRRPAIMAAMAYDAAGLLDAAIRGVNGRVTDTDAFREALKRADFQSVRGPFAFNRNNFPIQNFYLNQVDRDARGNLVTQYVSTVLERRGDSHVGRCSLA